MKSDYHYYCGGYFNGSVDNCKLLSASYDYSNTYSGLRLALSIN